AGLVRDQPVADDAHAQPHHEVVQRLEGRSEERRVGQEPTSLRACYEGAILQPACGLSNVFNRLIWHDLAAVHAGGETVQVADEGGLHIADQPGQVGHAGLVRDQPVADDAHAQPHHEVVQRLEGATRLDFRQLARPRLPEAYLPADTLAAVALGRHGQEVDGKLVDGARQYEVDHARGHDAQRAAAGAYRRNFRQ